jgi:hypothetical protein
MNICAEFEQEKKGGRWVATIPGVREVVGYGSTRHQAAVGLTVSALHVLADRVKGGQLKVEEAEDEPIGIFLSSATIRPKGRLLSKARHGGKFAQLVLNGFFRSSYL